MRPIKRLADEALAFLSEQFGGLYSSMGDAVGPSALGIGGRLAPESAFSWTKVPPNLSISGLMPSLLHLRPEHVEQMAIPFARMIERLTP